LTSSVYKPTELRRAEVVDDAFKRVRVTAGRTHVVVWTTMQWVTLSFRNTKVLHQTPN